MILNMDPFIVPSIGAAGRVAGALIARQPRGNKPAVLELSVETEELGPSIQLRLQLTNTPKPRVDVVITKVTVLLKVHDGSCADPEFIRLPQIARQVHPKTPFSIKSGGQTIWTSSLPLRELTTVHAKKLREAQVSAWGEERVDQIEEDELRRAAICRKPSPVGLLSRLIMAIDYESQLLRVLVETEQHGSFESKAFHVNRPSFREIMALHKRGF